MTHSALAALLLTTGLMFSPGMSAKDLGSRGHLFPIAEPDLLEFIAKRLGSMEESGELERLKTEAVERVKRNAVRPSPVPGLTPASEDRTFTYDPSMVVSETLTDMQGRVIARKGDKVNPLDKVPSYRSTLLFLDSDNKTQMQWVKKQIAPLTDFKIILVNGNVREASDALEEPVYFDQAGVLTTKFGFRHTPVVITREGQYLKVKEVFLQ
ncbi:type-F conjugative transfer system protein TraW [Serratia proteamaculans]|uniref:type-F conjugative transfer system protein TraW n=1 Tax=Serratia proteamaculans TaxID=28151 RepID=UPI0039BE7F8B